MKVPISSQIDLSGKVAIVTGGARGIGKADCIALAREGADIVVCDISSVEETVGEVKIQKRRALGLKCDVTHKEEVKQVVDRAIKEFGRVDILVNNAGVWRKPATLEEISIQDWDYHIDNNLKGTFLFSQAVWPTMVRQKSGKIICIGSVAANIGGVFAGPDYCASKGGVHGMVKWFAKNGAPLGIYVNGIAPGPCRTLMTREAPFKDEMIPVGRLGEPEDIAEVVVFLASSASNYITGIVLDVNGGLYLG